MKRIALLVLMLSLVTNAIAASPVPSVYAGQESRDIKALSAEDWEVLQAGKGMGLARAAEFRYEPISSICAA